MAKKAVSSWKSKKRYTLAAPDYFEGRVLGSTIADDPGKLAGRTVKVNMKMLIDDRSKQYMNIIFEVDGVDGENAKTRFKRFFIDRGYLKSKIRKGMTKLDYSKLLKTSDGAVKVKIMVAASRGLTVSQKRQLTDKVTEVLTTHETDSTEQVVQLVVFGKLGTEVYHALKKMCRISRVEVMELKTVS